MNLSLFNGSLGHDEIFRQIWKRNTLRKQESFYALYLDHKKQLIHYVELCSGNHSQSSFNIRGVLERALNMNAEYVIIAHNHIAGGCEPSERDKFLTKRIIQMFDMIDMELLDHIILTADDHYSFAESGLMEKLRNAG